MLAPSLLYLPSLISGGNLPFRIRSRIAILPIDSTDKIASSGPTNSTEVHSKVQTAGANIHPQLAQHFAFLSPPTVSIHLVWRLKLAVNNIKKFDVNEKVYLKKQ
jgi:hypothetical protein